MIRVPGRRVLGPLGSPSRAQLEGREPPSLLRQILRLLFIAAIIAVVIALPLAFFVKTTWDRQGDAPAAALRAFCADMEAGDYATAYLSFDAGYRSTTSAGDFAHANTLRKVLLGPVQHCRVDGRNLVALNPRDASFDVTLTLSDGAHMGTVILHQYPSGDWLITTLSPELHLD